jgi:subtilase-type proteinase RRT12
VDIYVLDTGINIHHPEFEGRATFGQDFTGEGPGDLNGHGTCVAGVAGSRTFGTAKRVNLVDIKTVNRYGRGKLSSVLSGLEYVAMMTQNNSRKSVVNISLGTPKNALFNQVAHELISLDVPVVCAAGNLDTSACRFSPASAKGVLVIGALDDKTNNIAHFSNWGQCVDAFASGVNVESVALVPYKRIYYSGTSVAAPIGSGLVAYYMGMGDSGRQAIQRVSIKPSPKSS